MTQLRHRQAGGSGAIGCHTNWNVVQPGPTDTDMNPADGPMRDLMHSFMAIKRHATGHEIAGMVAYLAGPEAAIVTGAMHTIDGGFGA